MNKKTSFGLVFALVFQFVVLTGMVVSAAMPLLAGEEIKIKTIPVDPRSMFRGNYAQLRYDFSRIDSQKFKDMENMRSGEVVYVLLKTGKDDVHEFDRVQIKKPTNGVFLRGRLENRYHNLRVKCGIEAFFAPKEKAIKLETELRDGGIAVLMVSGSGRARLKDVMGINQ